ncbi:MAG TPA: MraY family glycosyltransferase [Lacipirellulaceae bacterium]|nr:MraY family glycosyltransferase [Lacipirellulaceae bacterium]
MAALAGTPLIARLCAYAGAVDAPDGRRKAQKAAVPLGGGIAVGAAALGGVVLALGIASPGNIPTSQGYLNAALPSALVLVLVGLIDDTIGLTGIYKLIGQFLSASLLAAAGFQFESISVMGYTAPLGALGTPFSIFFCLGAINAFNLIDGADGLASSIGAVVCLTLGIIVGLQGSVVASLASFATAGALVGFLRFNAPPARVYLGDTGSMLIGWLVAAVAIRCSIKEQTAVALVVPLAICAIPILDAAAAMVRRITTGQSVFTADRGHLHHALLLRGWSVGQTASLAAGLTAITCAGATASFLTQNEFYAIASIAGVVVTLVAARIFGHAEVALVRGHARIFAGRVLRRVLPQGQSPKAPLVQSVQVQGRREWSILWDAVREAAVTHNLASVRLNVNIPHLHESFFANWSAPNAGERESSWRMALPLTYGDRSVGRLLLTGHGSERNLAQMQQMLEYLEPMEAEIARILEESQADRAPAARPVSSNRRRGVEVGYAVAADHY